MEDQAFSARHTFGLPDAEPAVAATGEQLRRAGQEPHRGWPAYDIMYPMGNPQDAAQEPIFASKNYRNFGPKNGRVTGAPLEPLARAPNFAGAR